MIAVHQERGRLAPGDRMRMLTTLIAPLMVIGLWPRAGIAAAGDDLDPEAVVAAFLDDHRAR
ncbi:hypothetical protein [Amycolatopsis sp. FDAARGOS 1241]|uniref:hypothetical protein n=1 Tax=Amycolatopsis sp. FDAARGOS 1241 TaxID=2778070 RepID=UPI00194EAB77|nr:hypothetical protein [Amycolatopsis sp. FDAARGOS 1241]QRP50303.1 hypothetical protein I6J71_22980 [Amycolatopsis sp. FDAARGOS 1241]